LFILCDVKEQFFFNPRISFDRSTDDNWNQNAGQNAGLRIKAFVYWDPSKEIFDHIYWIFLHLSALNRSRGISSKKYLIFLAFHSSDFA